MEGACNDKIMLCVREGMQGTDSGMQMVASNMVGLVAKFHTFPSVLHGHA